MKYPIYNKRAYFFVYTVDLLLGLIPKKPASVSRPKKILISNSAHLGDVILTTHLLAPLKKVYPELKIGFLVGSWARPAVESHSLIDWIHIVDHWKNNKRSFHKFSDYIKTRRRALREVKEIGYDSALDCNFHFPNMAPFLWQAKIPVRIGFESAGLSQFLTHSLPWKADENSSALFSFFSLLQFFPKGNMLKPISETGNLYPNNLKNWNFGCAKTPGLIDRKRPHISNIGSFTIDQAREFSRQPKSNSSGCLGIERRNFIVIHMGCSDQKKEWPLEKWKALSIKLEKEGHQIVFTGKGAKERERVKDVMLNLSSAQNLCDRLSWRQFESLLQNCALLIGLDSAAGHLAAKSNTPAVLLYTGIHPDQVWIPFSQNQLILRKKVPCSPCFVGCKRMPCIQEISVEKVYDAFLKTRARSQK